MLKQRIITALILAPIVIGGIFFLPPLGFSIFVALVLTVGAWEWANLAGFSTKYRYVYAVAVSLAMGIALILPEMPVLITGALWWCLALVLVIQYPNLKALWSSKIPVSLIGLVCIIPAYISMVVLKQFPDSSFLILLLFFLTWGADIGAYFAGRAFGRHKLAVNVSPGKSWEGFFGGLVFATMIATGMIMWIGKPVLFSAEGLIFLIGCMFVVMVSVLGDLSESMFKRNRGVKDSSQLLPGHGGVLDRLDSLLSASPLFALMIVLIEGA